MKREEVRGLFVLGIIAIVVAYRSELAAIILPTGPELGNGILIAFVGYWGLYAFFVIIAVSDDIFQKKVCKGCLFLARLIFWSGTLLLCSILILAVPVMLLGDLWTKDHIAIAIIAVVYVILLIVFYKASVGLKKL